MNLSQYTANFGSRKAAIALIDLKLRKTWAISINELPETEGLEEFINLIDVLIEMGAEKDDFKLVFEDIDNGFLADIILN